MTTELLEENKTENMNPYTIRIEDSWIESIKQQARKQSYEQQIDVTHNDLVRSAISLLAKGEINFTSQDPLDDNAPSFVEFLDFTSSEQWTSEKEARFLKTDVAKEIQASIDSKNWDYMCVLACEIYDYYAKKYSVAAKFLLEDTKTFYRRNVASRCFVVARRGAVPDQIVEGEEVWVPPFEICCNPSFRKHKLNPVELFQSIDYATTAIIKEMNSNVFVLLENAGKSNQCGPIEYFGKMPPHAVQSAVSNILGQGLFPSYAIVNSNDYIHIHSWGKEALDAPPLQEALKNRDYGYLFGAKVYVDNRAPTDKVIVLAEPKSVGYFVNNKGLDVEIVNEQKKLRKSMVYDVSIGLVVMNDWAVTLVEPGKKPISPKPE